MSGAGKSTIAEALHQRLAAGGRPSYVLDGDVLRQGLNADLGFSIEARSENIRRVAYIARMMAEAGLVVVVALISPFGAERRSARAIAGEFRFVEVYVDTPLNLCERRDPKGLYRKARAGLLSDFTGIDSPYEPPISPEVAIETSSMNVATAVDTILRVLAGDVLVHAETERDPLVE